MAPAKKRILLVDDDPGVQKAYGQYLTVCGYEVASATTGTDALAKVSEHPPDLIILDIGIPDPNGYEVCTMLKRDPVTQRIPIVMFTVKGRPHHHIAGLVLGADAYISKSCEPSLLLEQVRACLAG